MSGFSDPQAVDSAVLFPRTVLFLGSLPSSVSAATALCHKSVLAWAVAGGSLDRLLLCVRTPTSRPVALASDSLLLSVGVPRSHPDSVLAWGSSGGPARATPSGAATMPAWVLRISAQGAADPSSRGSCTQGAQERQHCDQDYNRTNSQSEDQGNHRTRNTPGAGLDDRAGAPFRDLLPHAFSTVSMPCFPSKAAEGLQIQVPTGMPCMTCNGLPCAKG